MLIEILLLNLLMFTQVIKFQEISGNQFPTSLIPVPTKELEIVRKYLSSLKQPDDTSESLLLQQTTHITETFSAETQPETSSFSEVELTTKEGRLISDENNIVSSRTTNDLVITLLINIFSYIRKSNYYSSTDCLISEYNKPFTARTSSNC